MDSFEYLENEACEDGIDIITHEFKSMRIKGLYIDGTIGINSGIDTSVEKACVLAEELGHHYTSVGNILDMDDVQNRKQERQARLWAYNKLIGLNGIIKAYEAGCHSRHETAEYLDVTENFLQDCIYCYTEKYGICAKVSNYTIFFIPNLAVMEMI